jgi:hypothetical protein
MLFPEYNRRSLFIMRRAGAVQERLTALGLGGNRPRRGGWVLPVTVLDALFPRRGMDADSWSVVLRAIEQSKATVREKVAFVRHCLKPGPETGPTERRSQP